MWGGQGVVAGEYYKEEIGKGKYKLEGDLFDVPEAPEWLLSRMKDQYKKKHQDVDVKYVDNRWSKRTKEERIAIVSGCLSVIKYTGPNSERYWWEIGAMINNELPGEEGLNLWREWSKRDPDYEHCWDSDSDPCAARWYATWRNNGAQYNMSHLIKLADEVDPDRKRFKEVGLDKLIEDVEAIPLRYKEEVLDGEDLIQRYMDIDNDPKNENPALHNQAVHKLAIEAKRGNAAEIERLVDTHEMFNRTKGQKPLAIDELDDTPFEYLIPGLLPKPWTLLVHADGGTGKTAMCQTVAKHIGHGKAFNVYGALVNVPTGKVLWLNGDQNERILRRQMKLIGCDKNVRVVTEWDMQWYSRFKKMQNKYAYDLVVIDSLDGCNDSNPYEENRREYALPIKKLVRRNGQDFPACSIVIIHHNTKEGKFRGTSAIKNAVDETWKLSKPDKELSEQLGTNTRIIRVEKSRFSRMGSCLLLKQLSDLSFELKDYKPKVENSSPASIIDRILEKLRTVYPETRSRIDLNADPLIGGNVTAIRKSLERLVDRGLIQIWEQKPSVNGGRPTNYYKAILVRGDKKSVALNGKPSDNNDLAMRQVNKNESCHIGTDKAMRQEKEKDKCRIDKPLPQQESTTNATGDLYSPVRGNDKDAWKAWK